MKRISSFRWSLASLFLATIVALLTTTVLVYSDGPWYVAPTGKETNDCLSSSTACDTITRAIGKAVSGDTIFLAEGTYTDASGEVFPLNLPARVSLIGSGRETTAIAGVISQTIIHIEGSSTQVLSDTILSDFTLQNGDIGLSIHAIEGQVVSPRLEQLRLYNNRIGLNLSTVEEYATNGATISPYITEMQVVSNTHIGIVLDGYTFGILPCHLEPTLLNSTIEGNGSDGIFLKGAAPGNIYCANAPHIINTRISDNGRNGINYSSHGYGSARPIIERSLIVNNQNYGIRWGSVNVSFGGVDPHASVVNSVIAGNQGGGLYFGPGRGSIQIINSTVVGNTPHGLYWEDFPWNPVVVPTVINTIIWNEAADDLAGRTMTTDHLQYSDIKDGDLEGQAGNLSIDPLLNADYRLSLNSPAIDAGTTQDAPATDIDGEPRPCGRSVDIGADEYRSSCPTIYLPILLR